jgi:hypothetical protein
MKRRLGEILLSRGLITPAQLGQALQIQATSDVRIGTALVQLEAVRLDEVGRCLSIQHGLPQATPEMVREDQETLGLIPKERCVRSKVLPLGLDGEAVQVAMLDPGRRLAGEVSFAIQRGVQRFVAPELRMMYWLERYFGVPREPRFLRPPTPSQRQDDRRSYAEPTVVGSFEVEVDDDGGLVMLDQNQVDDLDLSVGDTDEHVAVMRPLDLLLLRLEEAERGGAVAKVLVEPIHPGAVSFLLLGVRNEMATGILGHEIDNKRFRRLVAPLTVPSVMQIACRHGRVVLARANQAPVVTSIARSLDLPPPGDVAVAPVVLAGRVVNLLVIWAAEGKTLPDGTAEDLARLVHAAAEAYGRITSV